jgi:ferredoxin-type protein NapH
MKLQILRRCVQFSVIGLAAAIAVLSLYAHYRAARVIDDEQLMAGLQCESLTKGIHPYIERLDDPQALLDGNKGTLWSMQLMGINFTDPLAAVEMLAASKTAYGPLWLSVLIPVVLTLLLGKVFCSWLCPGYVLFEVAGKLRKLLRIAEIQPGNVTFSHANKYVFLVVGLAITAVVSTPLFALIYPPAVISRAMHAWIFGTGLVGMLLLLGGIVAVEVLVSPRWWCRTVCPGGALYGLLGWARPLRIKLRRESCTGCKDCIPVCEAGINPITESASIECDNCGVCIRHCGDGALYYTIGLPEVTTKHVPHRAPVCGVTVLVVGMLVSLLAASPASGHHILGLPHYSYKENYPQRPTLEFPATTGPYDVLLTSYPGVPVPAEPVNLALYIKNRDTRRVLQEPVTIRVLQTHTFGDNTVILPATTRSPFDNEYKFHVTFPVDGEYIVELSMPVEGRVEVIPFLIVAGQPTASASILLTSAVGLVVLFVVVRAVQVKRKRRLRAAVDSSAPVVPLCSVSACGRSAER